MAKVSPLSSEDRTSDQDALPGHRARIRILQQEPIPEEKSRKLRNFAIPLSAKREIKEIVSRTSEFESHSLGCSIALMRCKACCINFGIKTEIWRKSFIKIEGLFGSGVLSYFVFLKYLFIMNIILFLIMFVFTIIPQSINSTTAAESAMLVSLVASTTPVKSLAGGCSMTYSQNWTKSVAEATIMTKIQDFFQGTGWLERNVLFFGYYFPTNIKFGTLNYDMPLAYMLCVGVVFFISLLFMLRKTGESFDEIVVTGSKNMNFKYSDIVLTGWDYSLMDETNSELKHRSVLNTIWGEIQDEKHIEKHLNMSGGRKCGLWFLRILINLLIVGMLGGAAYLIYFVQTVSTEKTTDGSVTEGSIMFFVYQFLPSVTITVVGAVYPIVFKLLVRFEDYRMETSVLLTLLRTVFVRLAAVAMLIVTVYIIVTCNDKDACLIGTGLCTPIPCWETYMGQQFYKLLVTQFLVGIIVTLLVETPRALLAKKCSCKLAKLIGQPEFDTPKNVLDLIYVQILCWFGTLFCPLMPGMTFVVLLVMYYCKKLSCFFNYKPSNMPYRATSSTIFFMVLLFASYFLCLLPIGWVIIRMSTSPACGPFRVYIHMFDVIPAVINTWSPTMQSLLSFLTSAAFLYVVLVILLMIIYYFATVARARERVNKVLEEQLKGEAADKQILAKRITKITGKPIKSFRDEPPPMKNTHFDAPTSAEGSDKYNVEIDESVDQEGWE